MKMQLLVTLVLAVMVGAGSLNLLSAQDLSPRAYVITPVHSNAVTLTYLFSDGSIVLDGISPLTGVTGIFHAPILSFYHSLGIFGHSANITASLPYAVGTFHGTVQGEGMQIYRSGFMDSSFRFAVNIKGGPALPVQEFAKWQQKVLLGVSLKVVAPTGQYDQMKLINWGTNRWSFKPELGYSERWGHWVLDGYGGAWFFTTNPEYFSHNQYFPGTQSQSQKPMGSFEGHLSYDVKPRFWFSLDGNFWFGGRVSLNGTENDNTLQTNSRVGATVSIPVSKHQSLKVSYSDGVHIEYGGNYNSVSVGWQYGWLGKPN